MHPRVLKLFWGLKVRGVIHAGAHKGEEELTYHDLSFGPVTWIEAIPELAQELSSRISAPSVVLNKTLWSTAGQRKTFHVTNFSGSSSLFELDSHEEEYPHVTPLRKIEVVTSTLDSIDFESDKNLLVLDLQGAEFQALQGGMRTLEKMDYVLSEVNRKPLYRGINLVRSVDSLLSEAGFVRVATRWTRHGWGEALFIQRRILASDTTLGISVRARMMAYWLWLHLAEIPVVFFRTALRSPSRSKAPSQR